jgi:hypothetical protein
MVGIANHVGGFFSPLEPLGIPDTLLLGGKHTGFTLLCGVQNAPILLRIEEYRKYPKRHCCK